MLLLHLSLLLLSLTFTYGKTTILGDVQKLRGRQLKDAEQILKTSLMTMATTGGPKYELRKVISASHQVVAGSLYKYNVNLMDRNKNQRICLIHIWLRPWLSETKIVIKCIGDKKMVLKYKLEEQVGKSTAEKCGRGN